MTAPYTQQNYADWKRRFPGGSAVAGLLGQAKQAAGIEDAPEQAPPLLAPTPNPQAPDPLQQSNQGLLAQQLSASPMQGEGAPQSLLGNHEHRKGLKGLFSHLLRSDRIATDVDSELTPEQSKQARGSALGNLAGIVFNSESPAAQQARRADEMLARGDRRQARQDLGTTRATEADQMARFRALREEAEKMPVGQERSEFFARGAAEIMNNPVNAMQTAVGLREREFAPQAPRAPITKNTEDGIMQYNLATNQWEPMRDAEGRPMMAPPTTGSFGTEPTLIGPNGRPMVMNRQTGRMEEAPAGVERVPPAGGATPAEIRVITTDRQLAFDDAKLSMEGLLDANGVMADPPSNFDRAATRSEWSNALASNSGQAYMNNVRKLIRSWVVLIEGKRMSDADARVNELQRSFAFGDGPDVIASKKRTLESMAASIRALGKNGVAPSGATPPAATPPANDVYSRYGLTRPGNP